MMRTYLSALAFLTLDALAAPSAEREWFYTDVSTPAGRQLVISETSIGGHRKSPATFCDRAESFRCIRSDWFKFAVPKDVRVSAWSFDQIDYKRLRTETQLILGHRVVVEWIEADYPEQRMLFLYSRSRGLVAFTLTEPRGPSYVIENSCGVVAPETCR